MDWRLPLVAALAVLAACSHQPVVPHPVPLSDLGPERGQYLIAPGDELEVKLFYVPDLNQTVTVRPDGRISLPLLGDVEAEGHTPAGLAQFVENAYGERLKRPQTVVNVRSTPSQRIFVGGEVWRAGMQPLAGPTSVLQAVMAAEGPRETARTDEVVVVRRASGGARQVFVVNLQDIVSGKDAGQDVQLQPMDVVVVPRSDVADLDLWVDQYIRRVLPFYTSANVGYTWQK